ncbi:hypothetical protein [Aestuariivirga litoralis]|uniref:hypothetical protein n=1 Tax=Aestuariivirga litoralis TaxID=2650924 RepID=UPI0018C7E441|nr:hypothetical protein [Aestuariivirga litoralis]MBG1232422.1 hypothetical protein [Aestuariivirga litoralis]
MRTTMLISLVVMQFTVLPFFAMLASAREPGFNAVTSGESVVLQNGKGWPDWMNMAPTTATN